MRLIQPTEAIEVKQICCLTYGQPGSRKTSLAQTAANPITLAFDPGVYRAFGRKTAALFDSWQEVVSFDTKDYSTVVVDTVGMCLEKLSMAIINDNPKNGNRLGGLSLPGYGILKARFADWVGGIRARGQDLVFLSHEKAERNGDDPYYCPDVIGGSYNTLMNHCDMVGYLHFANGKRCLDFNPSDKWMAKTPPCDWGTIVLPDFAAAPTFLADLLSKAKALMGQVSAQSAAVANEASEWEEWLPGRTVEEVNAALPDLKDMKPGLKAQVWHLFVAYMKTQGAEFDKGALLFRVKEGVKA